MKQNWLLARRWILQNLIPEWIWPKQVELHGVNIPLRSMPYSFGTKWLLRNKGYELEERQLLMHLLQPGMQVIEMGSSIGILTAMVAEKIGPKGRVVAVEASAKLTAHSTRWLAKYPWCTVLTGFGFPVWKAPGLRIDGFNEVRGSLGGVVSFSTQTSEENDGSVAVYDLEKICSEHELEPQLLLIDVEGSEQLMRQVKPDFPASVTDLVIELHLGLYPEKEDDQQAIIAAIRAEGFDIHQEIRGVWHFSRTSLK